MSGKPKRIQLRRSKGWRMPPNTVKVDRSTRGGNPFRVGEQYVRDKTTPGGGQSCNTVENVEQAVRLFRRFVARQVRTQVESYRELRGKNLACWCPLGRLCHADVLLELANRPESEGA